MITPLALAIAYIDPSHRRDAILMRFEDALTRSENGCWLWNRGLDTHGYGLFSSATGSFRQAHKWAWILYRGRIPSGMCVLHKCDQRACVNPDHLWLGTHRENMIDCDEKGRRPKGMSARTMTRKAKLTADQARAIRGDPRSKAEIAKQYGVSEKTVQNIKTGARWWWA